MTRRGLAGNQRRGAPRQSAGRSRRQVRPRHASRALSLPCRGQVYSATSREDESMHPPHSAANSGAGTRRRHPSPSIATALGFGDQVSKRSSAQPTLVRRRLWLSFREPCPPACLPAPTTDGNKLLFPARTNVGQAVTAVGPFPTTAASSPTHASQARCTWSWPPRS